MPTDIRRGQRLRIDQVKLAHPRLRQAEGNRPAQRSAADHRHSCRPQRRHIGIGIPSVDPARVDSLNLGPQRAYAAEHAAGKKLLRRTAGPEAVLKSATAASRTALDGTKSDASEDRTVLR